MSTNAIEQTHVEPTPAAPTESAEGDLAGAIEMANSQDWDDIGSPGEVAEAPANEDSTHVASASPTDQDAGAGEEAQGAEATPSVEAEPPAPAAPPAAPAEPEDDFRAVAERAAKRRLEQSQAQQSAEQQPPQPVAQQPAFDPSQVASFVEQQTLLMNDPLAYIEKYRPQGMTPRQFYERMTSQATGKAPQVDPEQVSQTVKETVSSETEALRKEIEQLRQERQAEQQQAAVAKAERDFDRVASAAEHYPLLSALDESDRLYWGDRIAAQYNAAGESWDYAKVARTAEVTLRKMQERWAPAGDGAGANAKTDQVDGDRKQGSAEPKTLTNAIAAESPGAPDPADQADWEILEDAKRLAETVDFDV